MHEEEYQKFLKDLKNMAAVTNAMVVNWGHILKAEPDKTGLTPEQFTEASRIIEHISNLMDT